MRLKTKLVLAITSLVLFISGLLSMVYVSQLLHASVQQSYESNRMVADEVRFALQNALEVGLKDLTFDPSHPEQLRELTRDAIRSSPILKAVLDSANRHCSHRLRHQYRQRTTSVRTVLSTNPDNDDKPLPVRPSYKELLDANPVDLMRRVFGEEARVYEINVPLGRNGAPFATVRGGVRTRLSAARSTSPGLKRPLR